MGVTDAAVSAGALPPPAKPKNAQKRKATAVDDGALMSKTIDPTAADEEGQQISKPKKKSKKKVDYGGEKRLRKFREKAPHSYSEIYERATTQRMFVLDRVRGGVQTCPEETLKIAGSTGNVYTVSITKQPTCNCPHGTKGNQCKHIVFAMVRVLRAPAELQYQLSLLSTELCAIFAKAPPIGPVESEEAESDGNRKPISPDDNCPICFMEFENGDKDTVYCKAACGNNIHKECMDQWAASRQRSSAPVTCPFCRTNWTTTENESIVQQVAATSTVNAEGYVNVGAQLGVSAQRDYSSYHGFWVRRQQRNGVNVGDWVDPNPSPRRRYYDD